MIPLDLHGLTGAELPHVTWRKSTHSNGNGGSCVETATVGGIHLARDSKNPNGPVLAFDRTKWRTFLSQVKSSKHDLA